MSKPKEIPGLVIRPAQPEDASVILALIRELAEYEKLASAVIATEAGLRSSLFGPRPGAEVLLTEFENQTVGYALFFPNYSTFRALPGMYLEDLFIRPAFRGRGFGKSLLLRLFALARERGYGRVEWSVLDWNQPAIDFYRALGAEPLSDWTAYRLSL